MVKKQKKAAPKKVLKKAAGKDPVRTPSVSSSLGMVPLGDRVIVKPMESGDERTASGFIIPDSARKEKPGQGKVVAVGEGRRNDKGDLVPLRVSVGDTIMFSKYGFDEISIKDVEYYVVSEPSILAILK
jgi:chaperonin GroES